MTDEPQALDRDILPDLLGYQLRRASRKIYGSFGDHLRQFGLTQGQFGVLVLIGANPGLTQTALAGALGSNRSLMVRTLDLLEDSGLVRRDPSPTDRRSHAIMVTDDGKSMIARLKKDVVAHEEEVANRLTEKESATLLNLLVRLNDG